MKTSGLVRHEFIKFFKEKDHIFLPAGPLILKEDTTMFCIAGMLL